LGLQSRPPLHSQAGFYFFLECVSVEQALTDAKNSFMTKAKLHLEEKHKMACVIWKIAWCILFMSNNEFLTNEAGL